MQMNQLKKQILRQERKRQRNSIRFGLIVGLLICLVIGTIVGGVVYLKKRDSWDMDRAELALSRKEYDSALRYYQGIYQRSPNSPLAPEAMFHSGRLLHRYKKEYRQAILLFLKMEDQFPDSPFLIRALEETAEIYRLRLQDPGRAVGTYQQLVELDPDRGARYQYEVAEAYYQLRNFEQARIEFEQHLKRWPDAPRTAEVLLRIAMMSSLEGKLLLAEDWYKKLITQHPDSPFALEARVGLVSVYEERGELTTALDLLEEIAKNNADNPQIQVRLEKVRHRLRQKNKR